MVKISSSKAQDTVIVNDDDTWFSLLTRLRQMEKNKDKERKLSYQLYVDATFNYFDREKTSPDLKDKAKSKAKPYSVRATRLESPIELSSNQEIKDIYQDDDDDLEASQNTKKTRDSTTKRQFREKASRVKSLPTQEYIRQ
jgi:hypothetical protein